MSSSDDFYRGFDELDTILKEYINDVSNENIMDALNTGASEFVKILNKLPKPKSKITSPGYTHLVNSFSYKKKQNQIEVGWGKYYGPMVENTTPHLKPCWNTNKELIYKKMINKIGGTF